MRALLLLAGAATLAAAAPPGTIGIGTLPPFAAELAQRPMIAGASDWQGETTPAVWQRLATAAPDQRQGLRWSYALGLLGSNRGAEAFGVLETMRAADRDLELVVPFQLARGVALTLLERDAEAVASLSNGDLARNPEACAWRLRALVHAGAAAQAVSTVNCALPAINGRTPAARAPFMLAAARAAIDTGQPAPALAWLQLFGDRNPDANVLRGRALLASGQDQAGRLRLERAIKSGTPGVVAQARLAVIQADLADHRVDATGAAKQLDALRYGWRGGPVEEAALRIQFKLATDAHDLSGQLRAGATLFRYFKLSAESGPMLTTLQATLAATLAPGAKTPLPQAAGLYWDYRELAPAGAEGDAMALGLAARLQDAGLYARAAELLQYQLQQRAQDVAQGPLSVRVAGLQILAGRPDRALAALRSTEQPSYTDAMRQDRKRMEAVALHRLGRDPAAIAALDGLPDAAAIRAEIRWRTHDWGAFVTDNEAGLPSAKGLDAPGQAAVLRQAVAFAMLGQEARLQALRARYAAAFKALPSAEAFDLLTRKPGSVDPAKLGTAMAAIPEASPAGSIGDLLDVSS